MELIDLVNSAIIPKDLIQLVHFSTDIPDCGSLSPALWDLFHSSDAFHPLRNSYCVVVSVSIDFLSNSKVDDTFFS